MKISWWFILPIILLTQHGHTDKGHGQMVLQSLESFVRRGIGFRYVGTVSAGSAGQHRLVFYLQISKLYRTIEALRAEIVNATSFAANVDIKVNNPDYPQKNMGSLKQFLSKDLVAFGIDARNADLQGFLNEFRTRMTSKRAILLTRLDLITEIVNNFAYIIQSREDSNLQKREKRNEGYIPVIGDLMSVIFGTETTKNTAKLGSKLEELSKKQNKMATFVNSFTTVVSEMQDKFLNIQQETLSAVNETFKEFQHQIFNVTIDLANTLIVTTTRIQNSVEKTIGEVMSHLDVFEFHLRQWLHGLIQTLSGKFPLEIISPEKLISYLFSIEAALPQGITLSITDFKHGSILETIEHTRCRIDSENGNMMMICSLELSKISEIYHLYRLFPAPVAAGNETAFGKPLYSIIDSTSAPYLGVTPDGLSYIELSDNEMDNCFKTRNTILCRNHFVERKGVSKSSCAYSIFINDKLAEAKLCKRSIATLDSLFVHPLSDSTYYFATNENSSTVTLKCPQTNSMADNRTFFYYHLNVTSSMIVEVSRFCAIYSDYFYISEEYFSESLIEVEVPQPKLQADQYEMSLDTILSDNSMSIENIVRKFQTLGVNPKYKNGDAVKIPLPELDLLAEEPKLSDSFHWFDFSFNFITIALILLGSFLFFKVHQLWKEVIPRRSIFRLADIERSDPAEN